MKLKHLSLILLVFVLHMLITISHAATLTLPSSLTEIGTEAFYGDTSLDVVVLPGNLKVIQSKAFANSSVKQINLPSSLYSIADNAFEGCSNVAISAEEDTYAYSWAVQNGFITIEGGEAGAVTNVVVPSTLQAGADLTVQVFGPADTIRHTVYLINDETGKSEYRTISKQNGTTSWWGYNLEHSSYHVIVYTVTNEYKTLEPVRKDIIILGNRISPPDISINNQIDYRDLYNSHEFSCPFSVGSEYAVEISYRFTDFEEHINNIGPSINIYRVGEHYWIDDYGEFALNGATITLRFSLKQDECWGQWTDNKEIAIIPMPKPTITLPNSIISGSNLVFSISVPENYEFHQVAIFENDGNGNCIYESYDNVHEKTLEVPGYILPAGQYQLYVDVTEDTSGISFGTSKSFTVDGEMQPGPDVTIDHDTIHVRDTIVVSVDTENADALRIRYNYSITDIAGEAMPEVNSSNTNWQLAIENVQEGTTLTIYASVRRNGLWTKETKQEYEIQGLPPLDPPVLHAKDTYEAGSNFSLSFDSVDNAKSYWSYLYNGNKRVYSEYLSEPSPLVCYGYDLEPGTYRYKVVALMNDSTTSSAEISFNVIGEKPVAPIVTVSNATPYQYESFSFSIDTHEADQLRYKKIRTTDYDYYDGERIGIQGETTLWTTEDEESFSYQFAIFTDEKWSTWSKPIYITIIEKPSLDALKLSAPSEIQAGSDFTFSFEAVPNAENYIVEIYDDDGYQLYYQETLLPGVQMSVPGYMFTAGLYYRLYLEARADNYKASTAFMLINVTGSREDAPSFTPDRDTIRTKDDVTFTIDTANTTDVRITARYILNNSSSGEYEYNLTPTDDVTYWPIKINSNYEGWFLTITYTAKCNDRWTKTKTVSYKIEGLPSLPEPVLHSEATYEAGTNFVLSFDAVENATRYSCTVYNGTKAVRQSSSANPYQIICYGYDLEPGVYRFVVSANADDYSASSSETTFSIINSKPEAPIVVVDQASVYQGDYTNFIINTANIEQLRYRRLRASDNYNYGGSSINVNNETTQFSDNPDRSYYYQFTVYTDGKWSAWSEPIFINVIEKPSLNVPELTAPSEIQAGTDYTFSFDAVDNAELYVAYLRNNDGNTIYSWNNQITVPGTQLTAPGYKLTAGQYYSLYVEARANNYKTSTASVLINVIGGREDAPSFTPDRDIFRVKDDVTFTIDTANTTDVYIIISYTQNSNWSGGYEYNLKPTDDVTYWPIKINSNYEGWFLTITYTAKRNDRWTKTTTVSYRIDGLPALSEPILHAEESYHYGTDISLSFDGVDNATSYEWYLYKNGQRYRSSSGSSPVAIKLNGYDTEPATYRYYVVAKSDNYSSSSAETTFIINDDGEPAPEVSVDTNNVMTDTRYTFTIDTTGAELLRYRTGNSSGSTNINVFSDSTKWFTSSWSAGTLNYQFCTKVNGRWTVWSDPITITVTSPTPPSTPSASINSTTIGRYQDLIVTVTGVADASSYNVYVYNENGEQIRNTTISNAEGGSATLYGYQGWPNSKIQIKVCASNGKTISEYVVLEATVADGTRPTAPIVVAPEATTIPTYEYFSFSIETNAATKAIARYYTIGDPNGVQYRVFSVSENESTDWQTYIYNSGYIYAYSFAVCIDGVWSEWSPFIEITAE